MRDSFFFKVFSNYTVFRVVGEGMDLMELRWVENVIEELDMKEWRSRGEKEERR